MSLACHAKDVVVVIYLVSSIDACTCPIFKVRVCLYVYDKNFPIKYDDMYIFICRNNKNVKDSAKYDAIC